MERSRHGYRIEILKVPKGMARMDPRNVPRERACLSCGNGFKSSGAHNRLCKACKGTSEFGGITA